MEPKFPTKPEKTDYPKSTITMIVPFGAGGGMDLQARLFEKYVPKYLDTSLVVINKPGGGGIVGWNELVTAKPNGYTLGLASTELLMQPIYGATRFHYPTALEPIAQFSSSPFIIVVNPNRPWNTIQDLVEYAKQNPHQLKHGHGGIGSMDHILGEEFAHVSDVKIEEVPFQGGAEVIAAVLGDHVQIGILNPAIAKEQINAGKLKALASTGEKRFADKDLAQIPTLQELGYDMAFNVWLTVVAPKEMPKEIREKLYESFEQMILDPEFKKDIEKLGVQFDYLDSNSVKDKWGVEMRKLSEMLKETGIAEEIEASRK